MRVGVVGVGSMGRLHAQLLAELVDPDALILTDVDPSRARAQAHELGARAVAVHAVRREVDALVIATPPQHHAPMLEAAVEARIPVLCEKPLALDLPETLRIAHLVERAGAIIQVGFQRRFDAAFAAAQRLAADGSLGRLHLLRLAAHDPRQPAPPRQAAEDRPLDTAPVFRDSSIHDFDMVRWLTGDQVVEVHADGSDRDGARPADPSQLETAVVTMRLTRGTMAVLDATLLDPRGYDIRAELVGELDSVVAGLSPRSPQRTIDPEAPPPAVPWSGYLERFRDAYRRELVAFLNVARGEAAPPVTVRDALEAMRIAVAATRSFVERRGVHLDEVPGLRAATRAEVA